ncbi:MAG: hypothetical protein KU37_02595 [Sulfuricurvum sp. PC08-66]|nr:MAG: hypothetical protein KU37_02595 [Sulfuricurvum sp. PC08-66]
MQQFENVTVKLKANQYFDGNVTSRTITFQDGSVKTLGIMMPGEYTFGTSQHEVMEILAGDVDVRLPNSSEWLKYTENTVFEVPANTSFDVRVHKVTDYCCSYS